MWWYYKCVNLIKVNTGIKSYSFLHRKCLARKPWTWVELRPIRTIWFDQPPVGGVQTGQLKRQRASGALSLLFPLATLGRSWTRRAQTRARLTWKPARWTLTTKPTIGGGLRLCQSRNGATNPTVAEESFPGDVTQPSQVSTREQPKEPSWTRDTRNKELNSRGKTKQLRACFKPIQASTNWIPNPD